MGENGEVEEVSIIEAKGFAGNIVMDSSKQNRYLGFLTIPGQWNEYSLKGFENLEDKEYKNFSGESHALKPGKYRVEYINEKGNVVEYSVHIEKDPISKFGVGKNSISMKDMKLRLQNKEGMKVEAKKGSKVFFDFWKSENSIVKHVRIQAKIDNPIRLLDKNVDDYTFTLEEGVGFEILVEVEGIDGEHPIGKFNFYRKIEEKDVAPILAKSIG